MLDYCYVRGELFSTSDYTGTERMTSPVLVENVSPHSEKKSY